MPAKAGIQLRISMLKSYYVYILASQRNGTLYTGITNNLIRRIYEHKMKMIDGFTKKYNTDKLIYFEEYYDVNEAIAREKQLKRWKRNWKIDLIEKLNPRWEDLAGSLLSQG